MIHNTVNNIIKGLKLPKNDREQIDRLLSRPEVQAVLNADQIDQVEHRKSLIAELKAIPAKIEKLYKSVEKDHAAIAKRFYLAEAEYKEAEEAFKAMQLANSFLDYQDRLRERKIKAELFAGADSRITDYIVELSVVESSARVSIEEWIENNGYDWLNRLQKRYCSNIEDVKEVLAEIEKAKTALMDMHLQALTHDEVTKALGNFTKSLEAPLWRLKLNPPTLDDFGEVKAAAGKGFKELEKVN